MSNGEQSQSDKKQPEAVYVWWSDMDQQWRIRKWDMQSFVGGTKYVREGIAPSAERGNTISDEAMLEGYAASYARMSVVSGGDVAYDIRANMIPALRGAVPSDVASKSPLGGLGDIIADYDRIVSNIEDGYPDDPEADFVMRGSDWREIRKALEPCVPGFDVRMEVCRIISRMLDEPGEGGIYRTTRCYDELEVLIARCALRPSEGAAKPDADWFEYRSKHPDAPPYEIYCAAFHAGQYFGTGVPSPERDIDAEAIQSRSEGALTQPARRVCRPCGTTWTAPVERCPLCGSSNVVPPLADVPYGVSCPVTKQWCTGSHCGTNVCQMRMTAPSPERVMIESSRGDVQAALKYLHESTAPDGQWADQAVHGFVGAMLNNRRDDGTEER